ncbi:tetratricopeptide repeat protein [Pseudenhygromyxa sp. WMMC2535]|uniref:tetratricopeptide repeat protein n=1 Tax=Pseudenhygromyxa sp. WMMC2535 TaxID=2712867 RepID=UPI0015538F38|nr:tetratricopeptide repeat protein [Pseudenhygromyxa sp. WMMC2535]NVB37812.1 tetratricopeptide repeat protein [Pseudenhygromyxa sp. WMMC2535]
MSPTLCLSALLLAAPNFTVTPIDQRPPRESTPERQAEIERLRAAIEDEPRERAHRQALTHALIDAGELEQALEAARAWRAIDAYNLVVVRLIGDILSDLGRPEEALRTYSAVTELLSEDPEAQRALAGVLEARGELEGAQQRLEVAIALRPEDQRLSFELADVAMRRGELETAAARFEAIAGNEDAPTALRYPARQRLGQIYAAHRRAQTSDAARAEWSAKIDALELRGGSENDIKVYLSWDTDRTDVDLWVTNPKGEKVYYQHRKGRFGGELFDDVTTGYGPESFTAPEAAAGTYAVEVHYFGGSALKEARGEVMIVVDEGREGEAQHVFPYVLPRVGQSVRVAEIEVETANNEENE